MGPKKHSFIRYTLFLLDFNIKDVIIMSNSKKAVILVGHGGLPSDIPSEVVEKFMRVHKGRIKSGSPITDQEIELDTTIRKWDRTPENDPYKTGLESLASHMEPS